MLYPIDEDESTCSIEVGFPRSLPRPRLSASNVKENAWRWYPISPHGRHGVVCAQLLGGPLLDEACTVRPLGKHPSE